LEGTLDKHTPITQLTAGDRDNWYNAHVHLSKLSKENVKSFKEIESALFAVCLDDTGVRKNIDESHLKFFHNRDASNRWFDKSIQLIISNSGRAGLNGEVIFFI
jgi:Choline/Carnitine o-acyltransferase